MVTPSCHTWLWIDNRCPPKLVCPRAPIVSAPGRKKWRYWWWSSGGTEARLAGLLGGVPLLCKPEGHVAWRSVELADEAGDDPVVAAVVKPAVAVLVVRRGENL